MRPSLRTPLAALASIAILASAACIEEKASPTQVMVVLNADAASRDAIRGVRLEVRRKPEAAASDSSVSTWEPRYNAVFTPGAHGTPGWPLEFRLTPLRSDGRGRYVVIATALDAEDGVIAQARAISGFVQGITLGLPMTFDAACLGHAELCGEDQTCRATVDGTARCVDARVDAIDLPEFRGSATLLDDGIFDETVASDGGVDGSVDERPPIADPCADRAGMSFCFEGSVRNCEAAVPIDRACGEGEACVEQDGHAVCVCAPGAMPTATDECEPARECGADHGGCDALTDCALIADAPACSACPWGFSGSGLDGCVAGLVGLEVTNGQLMTAVTPSTTAYEARVSIFERRASIAWQIPLEATLEIDGAMVAAAEPWTSPVLRSGENTFDVRINVPGREPTRLTLTVRRELVQDGYFKATPPKQEDGFGRGVSLDGDRLALGAPFEDRGFGSGRDVHDCGSAYIFERDMSGWHQAAYIKPQQPLADGWFGTTTLLRDDLAIISAIQASVGGIAYVFQRNAGNWNELQILEPEPPVLGAWFGNDMVMQGDSLFIGAPVTAAGRVYVFDRGAGGAFEQRTILRSSLNQTDSQFGAALAIDGNTFIASATYDGAGVNMGAVYVFEQMGTEWVETQRLVAQTTTDGDEFGFGVDVRGDLIAIGAPYQDTRGFDSGAAYIFEREGGEWVEKAMLLASNGGTFYNLGGSVKFLADDLLAVGSGGESSSLCCVSPDDSNASALSAGAVYLFGRNGDEWEQEAYIKAAFPGEGDGFGAPLSFSKGRLAVGAFTESGGASGVDGEQNSSEPYSAGAGFVFR